MKDMNEDGHEHEQFSCRCLINGGSTLCVAMAMTTKLLLTARNARLNKSNSNGWADWPGWLHLSTVIRSEGDRYVHGIHSHLFRACMNIYIWYSSVVLLCSVGDLCSIYLARLMEGLPQWKS